MTNLHKSNSKESLPFLPSLLPASVGHFPPGTLTPIQALVSMSQLSPNQPRPRAMLAGQNQDRGKVRITHAYVSHTHPFSSHPPCCNFSEYEHPKEEKNGKGEGLVETSSCQASSHQLYHQKRKRDIRGEKEKKKRRRRKKSYGTFLRHPLSCHLPTLHKTKAPNSAQLSPLLSQKHFASASEPKSP